MYSYIIVNPIIKDFNNLNMNLIETKKTLDKNKEI